MKFNLTIIDYENSGFWVLRLFSDEMIEMLRTKPVLEKIIATADVDLVDGANTLAISQLLIECNAHNHSLFQKDWGSAGIGLNMSSSQQQGK